MKLGVSYTDFLKNPFVAILFLAVMGLGYMYLDNKSVYKETIIRHEKDISTLKSEIKTLQKENKELEILLRNTIKEMK